MITPAGGLEWNMPRSDHQSYCCYALVSHNITRASVSLCHHIVTNALQAVILMPPEDVAVEEMDVMDEQLCIAAVRVRVYTDDMSMRKGMSTHPARIILVLNHIAHEFYFRDSFYGAVHVRATE